MTCSEEPKKGDYEFFEDYEYYYGRAKDTENKYFPEISHELEFCPDEEHMGCHYFLINDIYPKIEFPRIICEQFKKIYNILSNRTKTGKKAGTLQNNDCAFLNYWLNDKLRGANTDIPMCVKDFYQKLKTINENYFQITTLDDKLYNIKKHELDNMRNLYDLYNIKDKINEAITEEMSTGKNASCLEYAKECHKKYKEAIISCRGDCLYFYSLIKEFKRKYKNDLIYFSKSSFSCKSEELFELPNYGVVLKEHESVQIVRNGTLSVLLPVFGLFLMFKFSDKFTPFRQYILEKIKRRKNILFDEEERDSELLSYTSDDDSRIYNNGEYNISYYNVRSY
ncbi:PIR Superfamily Protein [Plasmodium ovale wallikeri]|uniref:PIR Superfamily Protein n=1 Tax=Plasmodium ovale wallikeri TaxID=864142 RepID=A0A1A9AQV6_PLAOA|nr:PIR Superfamily Protein [Plasmodium ovale wallikeri]SBT58620.1 PIR Superfamily Protein [Plasmodium ovale wallikeri]